MLFAHFTMLTFVLFVVKPTVVKTAVALAGIKAVVPNWSSCHCILYYCHILAIKKKANRTWTSLKKQYKLLILLNFDPGAHILKNILHDKMESIHKSLLHMKYNSYLVEKHLCDCFGL